MKYVITHVRFSNTVDWLAAVEVMPQKSSTHENIITLESVSVIVFRTLLQNFSTIDEGERMSTARTMSIAIFSAAVLIGIVHAIHVSSELQ